MLVELLIDSWVLSMRCNSRDGQKHLVMEPSYIRSQPDGVLLSVKLQPRASANQIGETLGNELRIKVTAAPVEAAANEALIRFLAEVLNCPRHRVELVRGHTSRHKVIKLHGLSSEAVAAKLNRAIPETRSATNPKAPGFKNRTGYR